MTAGVLILVGVLLVVGGVACWSLPAAAVVLGLVLTAAGIEETL